MFSWFNDFWSWLGDRFAEQLNALNPMTWVLQAAVSMAAMLPTPSPAIQGVIDQAVNAVSLVAQYISWFDYFVNLPFFLLCIGLMLGTETVLALKRAWNFIRSFVT